MNDNLSILNSKDDYNTLINELKEVYHFDIDALFQHIASSLSLNDDIESIITNFKSILNTCYEAMFLYNSNSKSIKTIWHDNDLFEHVMISAFYTVQYLTETRFIKASYLLNNEQPSISFFKKETNIDNCTILNPESLKYLDCDHSHTEKIRRNISSMQNTPKGKLFNTKKIRVNGKESEYIQIFLPYFSYLCSDFCTKSGCQPAKYDFTTFSMFKNNGEILISKELKRKLQHALDSMCDDYRYLLELFCDHYSDPTNPERLLFFYKLYRHFPVEALSDSLPLLQINIDCSNTVVSYCNLPNVFSRSELLYSIPLSEMESEFSYLREILLPLYEKLFFVALSNIYKQDYFKMQKILSDIFRSYTFKAERAIKYSPHYETVIPIENKIKFQPYKDEIQNIFDDLTQRGPEYDTNVFIFASTFLRLFTRFVPNKQRTYTQILTKDFVIPELTKKALLLRRISSDDVHIKLPKDEYHDQRLVSPLGIISQQELCQLCIADFFDIVFKKHHSIERSSNSEPLTEYINKIIEVELYYILELSKSDTETHLIPNAIEILMNL